MITRRLNGPSCVRHNMITGGTGGVSRACRRRPDGRPTVTLVAGWLFVDLCRLAWLPAWLSKECTSKAVLALYLDLLSALGGTRIPNLLIRRWLHSVAARVRLSRAVAFRPVQVAVPRFLRNSVRRRATSWDGFVGSNVRSFAPPLQCRTRLPRLVFLRLWTADVPIGEPWHALLRRT